MPPRKPKAAADAPAESPYVILIDTREKTPFLFQGLRTDAHDGARPLAVRTVTRGLPTGDYSVEGYDGQVAVERKSLADFYGTIGQGRERFLRELDRLNAMEYALVVVEANWQEILTEQPRFTKLPPKVVFRSVLAWQQQFPRVHWWAVGARRLAEVVTLRALERFWKTRQFRG
jgi:ERCC4-type nuclease